MLRSRVGAYVLGVLTVWPIGYLLFFVTFVVVLVARGLPAAGGSGPPTWFVGLVGAHVVTMALMLGLLVVYLVLPLRDARLRLEPDRRLLWVVLNVLVGPLAWPAFWWVFVRPGGEEHRLREADPVR